MSKDTRILFYTLLAGFLALFVTDIVGRRNAVATLTEEVRVGDGHVASKLGQHNDMMMQGR